MPCFLGITILLASKILAVTWQKWLILCGWQRPIFKSSFLLAGLAVGAVGGVMALSSVAPEKCFEILRLFHAGDMAGAAKLQREVIPINTAITSQFGIAGLKFALDLLGYYGGPVRSPLLSLTEEEQQKLRSHRYFSTISPSCSNLLSISATSLNWVRVLSRLWLSWSVLK
ncbi:MAG: hypothetical protein B5M51_09910 [Anaerolinea sp. 4484_236]|nr:MAG: hypothetical protein B5M51_09910 [Anaerolinea sp. 4484_236]